MGRILMPYRHPYLGIVPWSNCVASYPCNKITLADNYPDDSGNGRTLSATSTPTLRDGPGGFAHGEDGATKYFYNADSLWQGWDSDFTLAFFHRSTNVGIFTRVGACLSDSSNLYGFMGLKDDDDAYQYAMCMDGALEYGQYCNGGSYGGDCEIWEHWCLTYDKDGDICKWYLDGELIGSRTKNITFAASTMQFQTGGNQSSPCYSWGSFFNIFDKVLTQSEVRALGNRGAGLLYGQTPYNNYVVMSRDLTNWRYGNSCLRTYDQTGLDSVANTATKLEDADASFHSWVGLQGGKGADEDEIQTARFFIGKDTSTTRFVGAGLWFEELGASAASGTPRCVYQIDTKNGSIWQDHAVDGIADVSAEINSWDSNWWEILIQGSSQTVGKEVAGLSLYPAFTNNWQVAGAVGAAQGSCIIGNTELYRDSVRADISGNSPVYKDLP